MPPTAPPARAPDGVRVPPGARYDAEAAEAVVAWFARRLVHIEGRWAGQPFVPLPWQADRILRPVFGLRREADGLRLIRTLYLEVARRAGKSTLGGGIALRMLLADGEEGAQVYLAAWSTQQAGYLFHAIAQMIRRSATLSRYCDVLDARKRIVVRDATGVPTGSFLQVLSGEDRPAFGINPSCVIFDELHAQEDRKLYDALRTSMGSRAQPLFVMITTAGIVPSLAHEVHEYALRVRDGQLEDPTFWPVLYGIAEGDDYHDPAVWLRCCPSLDELGLRPEYVRAVAGMNAVPSTRARELRFRFCRWETASEAEPWVQIEAYDACDKLPVDTSTLKGRPAWVGVDMANRFDIAAVCCVVRTDDGLHHCLWRSFIPRDHERAQRPPYDALLADGSLEATAGNTTSYQAVYDAVMDFCARFDVQGIAVDPHEAQHLMQQLEEELPRDTVVAVGGTCASQNLGVKETERLIIAGKLRTGGNATARWAFRNVRVYTNRIGERKLDKERSADKIDPWSAAVLAIGRAVLVPIEEPWDGSLKWIDVPQPRSGLDLSVT